MIKNFIKSHNNITIITHPGVGHIDDFIATGLVASMCEVAGVGVKVIKSKEVPSPAPGEGVIVLDQMGGKDFGPHVLVVDHHGGACTDKCTFVQVMMNAGIDIPSKGMLGKVLKAVGDNDTGLNFGGYQYGLLDLIIIKEIWTATQGEVPENIIAMAKAIANGLVKAIEKEATKLNSIKKIDDNIYIGDKNVSPGDVLEVDPGAEVLIQPNSQKVGCVSIVAITKNGVTGDATKFIPKLMENGIKVDFVHPKKFIVVVEAEVEKVAEILSK